MSKNPSRLAVPSLRGSVRRRALLPAAFLASTALALAACSSGGSSSASSESAAAESPAPSASGSVPDLSGQSLTYVSNGGQNQDLAYAALVQPFAEKTGLTVTQDSPINYAKIQAQAETGNVTWDVVNTGAPYNVAQCGTWFEKTTDVDKSAIPDKYLLDDCSVPVGVAALVLVYNTNKYGSNPPKGWADFFDTAKFPGKRGVWSSLNTAPFEIGLLGQGVPEDKLYPIDFDKSLTEWAKVKKDLVVYDALGAAIDQLVAQTVDMAIIVAPRGALASIQGAPILPVWDQNIITLATYSITKGTKNLAASKALLGYMATPEAQIAFSENSYIGPVVKDAPPPTDPVMKVWSGGTQEHLDEGVLQDQKWWATGDNFQQGTQAWTNFLAG